jgi:hypothetical protein
MQHPVSLCIPILAWTKLHRDGGVRVLNFEHTTISYKEYHHTNKPKTTTRLHAAKRTIQPICRKICNTSECYFTAIFLDFADTHHDIGNILP